MLRSVLVALDGSACSDVTTELAIRWSNHYHCALTGVGFVDEPGIGSRYLSSYGTVSMTQYDEALEEARTKIKDMLELFQRRCQSDNVNVSTISREGEPLDELVFEAQCHDVIMLGKEASIHFARVGDVLSEMARRTPRPIVVVPKVLPEGDAVLIADDGSLQAVRALQAFWASGLWKNRPVTVACVDADGGQALQQVERGVQFLKLHDISAEPCSIESRESIAHVLVQEAEEVGAGLIVMGAYGKQSLKEFLFGSVTSHILENAEVPIFLYH